jgi:hypothetical protein
MHSETRSNVMAVGLRLFAGGFIALSGLMLSAYAGGAWVYTIGLLAGGLCVVVGALIPDF